MTHPQPPVTEPSGAGPVGYDGAGVIERAYQQGVSDAHSGILDNWSFTAVPPHVSFLKAEEKRVLDGLPGDDRTRMEAVRGRLAGLAAEQAVTTTRVTDLETWYGRAEEDVGGIRTRIDRLAQDDERRRRRRLRHEGDAPEDQPGGMDATGPETTRWEGPYTSPPLPQWLKLTVLAALVAIDVPIQWVIFDYFHGNEMSEQVLAAVFAVSVASIMVLLPHLAGYLYRGRHTTGEERPVILTALILLLPCLYLAAMLGYLRARVLLVPPKVTDENNRLVAQEGVESAAEPLHAGDFSIIALFVMLLLITTGISFLLGTARFHPLRTAYEGATGHRDQMSAQLIAARGHLETLTVRRTELEAARDRLETSAQQRLADDRTAVQQTFNTARIRYLDGVAAGLADPKATEAIAALIETME
ncbi:hypothetical protein [Nonomuraea typhae]|uniref:Uncharacterized protein n=1 Tax=Nonomuraea typhae TaxID=2603600 RepID=A0ABW7YQG8_9ACTN